MIHTLVRDWMAKELSTAEPETEIIEAYQLMITDQIRRLPVVASDRLVGIVTLSDLYRVLDLLSNTEQTPPKSWNR